MRLSVVEVVVLAVAVSAIYLLLHHRSTHAAPAVLASWARTPGVLNPGVSQSNIRSTICVRGWTKTVRPPVSYTNDLKRKQMREYGLHGLLSSYQEDHLVSLELGGNPTDPRNLWPEPYPRAAVVDGIENDLNHKVCTGALTLAEAQREEATLKHVDG